MNNVDCVSMVRVCVYIDKCDGCVVGECEEGLLLMPNESYFVQVIIF